MLNITWVNFKSHSSHTKYHAFVNDKTTSICGYKMECKTKVSELETKPDDNSTICPRCRVGSINRDKRLSRLAATLSIIFLFLLSFSLQADTLITSYGLTISSTPTYGPFGSITQFDLLVLNPDNTGYYTYICRRPNLGPCANIQLNRYIMIEASLVDSCSSQYICGNGLIARLTYI